MVILCCHSYISATRLETSDGQQFVVLHVTLTVDNSAHYFGGLNIFAGHLTGDVYPRSPVYSVLNDKINKPTIKLVLHPTNRSITSYWR